MSQKTQRRLRRFAKLMGNNSKPAIRNAKEEYNKIPKNERKTLNVQMEDYISHAGQV